MFVAFLLIIWLSAIFVAAAIGRSKNRSGLAYGFFLSWIGVVLLAVLPRHTD